MLRATAVLVLCCAACHAAYPYEPGPASVSDAGPGDRGGQDAAGDAGAPGEADAARAPDDAAVNDARPVACPVPAETCLECDPITQPPCGGVCPAGDCDALPDARDPWPAECNALRFADAFCDGLGAWDAAYPDSTVVTAPGQVALQARKGFVEWIALRVELAAGMEESLVEVRWLPPAASEWELFLLADASGDVAFDFDPDAARACTVSRSPWAGYALRAHVKHADGTGDDASVAASYAAAPALLQSWIEGGRHVCRLSSEGPAAPALVDADLGGALPVGGTIAIGALNPIEPEEDPLRFELDYVRAFAPPPLQ